MYRVAVGGSGSEELVGIGNGVRRGFRRLWVESWWDVGIIGYRGWWCVGVVDVGGRGV